MVKRLNVSVPDDLYERIEKHRDYLGNLSALFQNAVDEKITARESFQKRIQENVDMESIAKRLKNEKAELSNDYRKRGREDGLKWAQAASYLNLQRALEFRPPERERYYHPSQFDDDSEVSRHLLEIVEEDFLMKEDMESFEDYVNEYTQQFLEGWSEGVSEFWNQIWPLLEAD